MNGATATFTNILFDMAIDKFNKQHGYMPSPDKTDMLKNAISLTIDYEGIESAANKLELLMVL